MTTPDRLQFWDKLPTAMKRHGFEFQESSSDVTPKGALLQATVNHEEQSFRLSFFSEEPPLWSNHQYNSIQLNRSLPDGFDFITLPFSVRPEYLFLRYENTDDDNFGQVKGKLDVLCQRYVKADLITTPQIFPYMLTGESPIISFFHQSWLSKSGDYCNFAIDITPQTIQAAARGLLPNHVQQAEHFCIPTPTVPLFPIPLNRNMRRVDAIYLHINTLPPETADYLFQGIPLPRVFSVKYPHFPHVRVSSDGDNLSLGVNANYNPNKTAKAFADHLGLYNEFYNASGADERS